MCVRKREREIERERERDYAVILADIDQPSLIGSI